MERKLVVAIFEDDQINSFICRNLLRSREDRIEGHVFENPEQGYKAAQEIDFDIVFIETHFFGRSFHGTTILSRLREISGKDFVSVATSALVQEGDAERVIASGFTMCVEKPLSFDNIDEWYANATNLNQEILP